MANKIRRNVRLSTELLEIVKELSGIMQGSIAEQGIEFIAFRKFNVSALLENSLMRGISHYIHLVRYTCRRLQLEEEERKVELLQQRLFHYMQNIGYYNKSPCTEVKAMKIDVGIKEVIEQLAIVNSMSMAIDITYNDMFKSCMIKGIYCLLDEAEALMKRFQVEHPYTRMHSVSFEELREKLKEKDTCLSALEKRLQVEQWK